MAGDAVITLDNINCTDVLDNKANESDYKSSTENNNLSDDIENNNSDLDNEDLFYKENINLKANEEFVKTSLKDRSKRLSSKIDAEMLINKRVKRC